VNGPQIHRRCVGCQSPPDEAKQMQQFIEPARAARICISAETTHWTAAMRKDRPFGEWLGERINSTLCCPSRLAL
jgi:hypothetical protein